MNHYIWLDTSGGGARADWKLLYYPGDPEYTLADIAINLKVDDAGDLKFKMFKSHPNYQYISLGHSRVIVSKSDDINDRFGTAFFWCFISEIDEAADGSSTVYCTGLLGALAYTVQPQYKFQGTPANYLIRLLNRHDRPNESGFTQLSAFYIFNGTVDTDDDYILRYTNYDTTLDCLRSDLMEPLGLYPKIEETLSFGHLVLSLYPIESYGDLSNQVIRFGENLLKYARNKSTDDLYTAVIPLGKKKENSERTSSDLAALDAYVDIRSVNNGEVMLVNSTAKSAYGLKCAVVHWEDVTQPSNLKTKAQAWLNKAQYEGIRLELTAIDLSLLGNNIDEFKIGDRVRCVAEPYGVDLTLPIYEMTIYPLAPEKNTVTLGMDAPAITSGSSSGASLRSDADSNSTLNGLVRVETYTYSYSSISASATLNVTATNFGITSISGYTPIAFQRIVTGNNAIALRAFNVKATGDSTVVNLYNKSTSSASGTVTVDIVYVKSEVIY